MTTTLEEIKRQLDQHNQSQLLRFYDELTSSQREELLSRIAKLDLNKIDQWIAHYVTQPPTLSTTGDIRPADYYPARPENPQQEKKYEKARRLGTQLISDGKVAAFVVAGGQGTRLGFDGPKGNFPISPIKKKTLFRIFAEMIKAAQDKYRLTLPWYLMTSPLNHDQTLSTFESADYFGLDPDDLFIFQQGTMPNFSFDGRILLADKSHIACSPDGHGGSLKALYQSGATEDMKKRGIEQISYFQVDNPLINIFDPLFVGLHALDEAQMSSKALIKAGPKEKVGNFCFLDGRLTVIEYSDLPDELAEKRNNSGLPGLTFRLGSIAIHMITRKFVEELNSDGFALPWHKAVKKIPHIDTDGNYVDPEEPNAVKLESFVFDALPLTEKSIILETIREQEFAPVKNATGCDSPETARNLMINRAADWLESAGIDVPRKEDGSPGAVIEMAPSFALHKEDVKQSRIAGIDQIPKINPGEQVYLK